MVVVIHTADGNSSTFEIENGHDEDQVLMDLHPDKAFSHHHIAIQGKQGITMLVSSKITYVELTDIGRTEWPFYDEFFDAEQVDDADTDQNRPEAIPEDCLHAVVSLTDRKRLKVRVRALSDGGMRPCPAFIMGRLLNPPSLHIHGKGDKVILVNGAHIVRCDFTLCPGVQVPGWHAEAKAVSENVRVY